MIVVIADDLSGAAELAGVALDHGLTAEVQTRFVPATEVDLICIDTDTRSLTPERAAGALAEIARKVLAARPAWIFKKCDSVLRGPVLAEARALAEVTGMKRILIMSANPSRKRTVRSGHYFIEDEPLHQTNFVRDPEHPRTTSRVSELLAGDLNGVSTPDAQSVAEVQALAATVDAETLAVGAADFFRALLGLREASRSREETVRSTCDLPANSLLVCGSAAAWPVRQAEAKGRDLPVFAFPYDVVEAIESFRRTHHIVIGVGQDSQTENSSPAGLVAELADAVARVLAEVSVGQILTEGGATTAAVMRRMQWERLRAVRLATEGVATLRPVNRCAPELLSKPGSYPWPKTVWPPSSVG